MTGEYVAPPGVVDLELEQVIVDIAGESGLTPDILKTHVTYGEHSGPLYEAFMQKPGADGKPGKKCPVKSGFADAFAPRADDEPMTARLARVKEKLGGFAMFASGLEDVQIGDDVAAWHIARQTEPTRPKAADFLVVSQPTTLASQ